jgi:hypothetical protein
MTRVASRWSPGPLALNETVTGIGSPLRLLSVPVCVAGVVKQRALQKGHCSERGKHL